MKSIGILSFCEIISLLPEFFLIYALLSFLIYFTVLSYTPQFQYQLFFRDAAYACVYIFFLTGVIYYNCKPGVIYYNFMPTLPTVFENILYKVFSLSLVLNYIKILVLFLACFCIIISLYFFKKNYFNDIEYFALLILSIIGCMFIISSGDLVLLFLSLELQSMSLFVLVAINKCRILTTEASLKFFVLGTLSSIFLGFGIFLFYYLLGSFIFYNIFALTKFFFLEKIYNYTFFIAIFFLLMGFIFKLGLVPLHSWAIDVYEGAPLSVAIYMATVVKLVYFIILLRILYSVIGFNFFLQVQPFLIFISVSGIFLGSILAVSQKKLKRLVMYSTLVHTSFILLSFSLGTIDGIIYGLLYLFIYILFSFFFWLLLLSLTLNRENGFVFVYLGDLFSYVKLNPYLLIVVCLFFFTVSGLPPFIGFWLKFFVLLSAFDISLYVPVIICIFCNVLSIFVYIRFIKVLTYDSLSTNEVNSKKLKFYSMPYINAFFLSFLSFFFVFLIFNLNLILLIISKFVFLFF